MICYESCDNVFITDGSKIVRGVYAGIFSDTYSVLELYSYLEFASAFQAEVLTILETCQWLGDDPCSKYTMDMHASGDVEMRATLSKTALEIRDAYCNENRENRMIK